MEIGAVSRDPFGDLAGWKQIAGYLGRSERWCRLRQSKMGDLPVWWVSGRVYSSRASLGEWATDARRRHKTHQTGSR